MALLIAHAWLEIGKSGETLSIFPLVKAEEEAIASLIFYSSFRYT